MSLFVGKSSAVSCKSYVVNNKVKLNKKTCNHELEQVLIHCCGAGRMFGTLVSRSERKIKERYCSFLFQARSLWSCTKRPNCTHQMCMIAPRKAARGCFLIFPRASRCMGTSWSSSSTSPRWWKRFGKLVPGHWSVPCGFRLLIASNINWYSSGNRNVDQGKYCDSILRNTSP